MSLPLNCQQLLPDADLPIALSAKTRLAGFFRASPIFLLSLVALIFCGSNHSVYALTFNLTFDGRAAAAPSGFLPAVNNALQFYQATFTDPITINLQVGWGTVNNQNMNPGSLGQSLVNGQLGSSFGAVKSALTNDAKTVADQTSVSNLPTSDPTGGAPYLMAHAEAKALGLFPSNSLAIDGFVGFSSPPRSRLIRTIARYQVNAISLASPSTRSQRSWAVMAWGKIAGSWGTTRPSMISAMPRPARSIWRR